MNRYHVRVILEPEQPALWAQLTPAGLICWQQQPGEPMLRPAAADLAKRADSMLGRCHLLEVAQ